MDSETKTSCVEVKDKKHKNEKKEKEKWISTDETLDEVCRQMSKLTDEEGSGGESASSSDSEDIVNAINYNTITSLAALKDIIQGDSNDTPETDSFFQHYFMNHCNNLSSRDSSSNSQFTFSERRRLSQCREEDEDDEKKDISNPPPSTVSSETCSEAASRNSFVQERTISEGGGGEVNESCHQRPLSPEGQTRKRTVIGEHHKFLVSVTKPERTPPPAVEKILRAQVHHNAHTVHFGNRGPEEQRPNVRDIFTGQNLHHDKTYFDSSLIEIRSTVDGVLTSSEDIWVRRTDSKQDTSNQDSSTKNKDGITEDKSSTDDKIVPERTRSGTWSSQTRKEKDKRVQTKDKKEKDVRRSSDTHAKRQKREQQRLDSAITRSTQSVGERRRRGSADDGQPHLMYQQTIHGTSGVSRRPALFDLFKSRQRGDTKKQPSIMQQVKAAVQNMTKSNTTSKETLNKTDAPKSLEVNTPPPVKAKDGSAHPHSGSDTKYYHTVTASSLRRPSAMAKVMDIFRGRASVPGSGTSPMEGADKRKARAISQQQHFSGGD